VIWVDTDWWVTAVLMEMLPNSAEFMPTRISEPCMLCINCALLMEGSAGSAAGTAVACGVGGASAAVLGPV